MQADRGCLFLGYRTEPGQASIASMASAHDNGVCSDGLAQAPMLVGDPTHIDSRASPAEPMQFGLSVNRYLADSEAQIECRACEGRSIVITFFKQVAILVF